MYTYEVSDKIPPDGEINKEAIMSLIEILAWTENPDNPLQIEFYIFLNKQELNRDRELQKFLGETYSAIDLEEYVYDLVEFLVENYKDVKDFIEDKKQEGYELEEIEIGIGEEDNPTLTIILVLEKAPSPKKGV